VADRAGVNIETLRYYERRGLLPEPTRSAGGHRDCGEDAVRFVQAVKEVQTLGFSLSEIEDYMTLTRRDPRKASAAGRANLERKLLEIDGKLDALRRMRAGLLRALDVGPARLDESTSSTAYLARAGRPPSLDHGQPLHVTNGASAAATLERTSVADVVLSWNDVLHVGPLAFDAAESRRVRAGFLAANGWGEARAIEGELERRDALLEDAAHAGHPLVLWFEHDLFDQLQLLQILAQLPSGAHVELVQAAVFLGGLHAEAMEALWPLRRRLAAQTIDAARDAWRGVTGGDLEQSVPALDYVVPALRRLREEREALSRTKRQLLSLLTEGPRTPLELFFANQELEEAAFLGDSWCFFFLYELAEEGRVGPAGGGRMPLPPPRGDRETFVSTPLALVE
jgi:DNA-binding transcriptional MerR regulator